MSEGPAHPEGSDPAATTPETVVEVHASTGRRRRRRRRRLLVGAGIGLAVLLLLATWGYVGLAGKIQTFDGAGLSRDRPTNTRGQDILLIGTDSRAGVSARLGGAGGTVGRSDTTILVHLYPGGTSAVAVSIPRDTLVTIPPCRLPDGSWTPTQPNAMFNSAFSVGMTAAGNPACTVNTVEKLTGLRIDHTVVANFAGFAAMSKAVGGVPVCLPKPVYEGDLNPLLGHQGKLLFPAGRQIVEGQQALDYVRIRHGIGDGSDIGRIQRQQAFLASLVMTIRRHGLTVSHIWPLVNAATANLTFDPSLSSPTSLLSFAESLTALNPADIDFVTMPWRYDGYRVAIVEPDAARLWSALRRNKPLAGMSASVSPTAAAAASPPGVPKGTGTVEVLNGTWTRGLAGSIAGRLDAVGYAATAGNAPYRNYTASQIHYRPSDAARAQLLGRYLQATLVPDPRATTLTVYVGTSHQWLRTARPGSSTKPRAVPPSVTAQIRKATANPCANLSYGSEA